MDLAVSIDASRTQSITCTSNPTTWTQSLFNWVASIMIFLRDIQPNHPTVRIVSGEAAASGSKRPMEVELLRTRKILAAYKLIHGINRLTVEDLSF